MSKMKDLAIDHLNNQKPTAAQKRFSNAVVYLHSNGINIYSRADDFYRRAIEIAAGINSNTKD